VLIAAQKVSQKAPIFNFEAVINKYKSFVSDHKSLNVIPKPIFLKLFVDLVCQGFLKSEGDTT
jgi:hypothetical protein